VQRNTSSKVEEFKGSRVQELKDSVQVESVAVQDSVVEVTTITIDRNEQGDTLKQSVVTDRLRTRNRDRVKDVEVRTVVKTDTVYIERRDSVRVSSSTIQDSGSAKRTSPVVSALKWVFWIIVAIGALMIGWKVSKVFKFFI
jgi:hypothetical protein